MGLSFNINRKSDLGLHQEHTRWFALPDLEVPSIGVRSAMVVVKNPNVVIFIDLDFSQRICSSPVYVVRPPTLPYLSANPSSSPPSFLSISDISSFIGVQICSSDFRSGKLTFIDQWRRHLPQSCRPYVLFILKLSLPRGLPPDGSATPTRSLSYSKGLMRKMVAWECDMKWVCWGRCRRRSDSPAMVERCNLDRRWDWKQWWYF